MGHPAQPRSVQALRGAGSQWHRAMVHVREADVHLGLDVDALPDLGTDGQRDASLSPKTPATPRPPTSAPPTVMPPQVGSRAKHGTSSICLCAG